MKTVLAVVSSICMLLVLAMYAVSMSISLLAAGGHPQLEFSHQMRQAISTLINQSTLGSDQQVQVRNVGGDDRCGMECFSNEWLPGLGQIPGANLDPYPGLMNGEQVGKVCAIYDKTKACLDKCPASGGKTNVERSLGIPKYLCQDSSLKQHAQCIYEAVRSVQSTCDAGSKCGKYKKVVDGPKPGDLPGAIEYMRNVCQYMPCERDCVKPTVERKCTASAYASIEGLPVKGAEMIKYMMDGVGMSQMYPQECRDITAITA